MPSLELTVHRRMYGIDPPIKLYLNSPPRVPEPRDDAYRHWRPGDPRVIDLLQIHLKRARAETAGSALCRDLGRAVAR
jgi:hypothetical protein